MPKRLNDLWPLQFIISGSLRISLFIRFILQILQRSWLKNSLIKPQILKYSDFERKICYTTDASIHALMQVQLFCQIPCNFEKLRIL